MDKNSFLGRWKPPVTQPANALSVEEVNSRLQSEGKIAVISGLTNTGEIIKGGVIDEQFADGD